MPGYWHGGDYFEGEYVRYSTPETEIDGLFIGAYCERRRLPGDIIGFVWDEFYAPGGCVCDGVPYWNWHCDKCKVSGVWIEYRDDAKTREFIRFRDLLGKGYWHKQYGGVWYLPDHWPQE